MDVFILKIRYGRRFIIVIPFALRKHTTIPQITKGSSSYFRLKQKVPVSTLTIDPIVINLLKQHKEKQNRIKKENKPFYNDGNFILLQMKVIQKPLNILLTDCSV